MSSTLETNLQRLYGMHRFGIKPGLDRIRSLLSFLGHPHDDYPAIHVAGTNGKGSVCSLIASILTQAGYKTGLYTSPHVLQFNERIRVNGVAIGNDYLSEYAEVMLREAERETATFFELTTAMALQYFSEQAVDIAVLETGMGGRLDATNVVDPLLSVITSIDMDHEQWLGDTLEKIAIEKAGIMKNGRDVIVAEPRPGLSGVFMRAAQMSGARLSFLDSLAVVNRVEYLPTFSMSVDISTSKKNFRALKVPLCGEHQARNTACAIAAIHSIETEFPVSGKDIYSGIAQVKANSGLTSRCHFIEEGPVPILIDVAHNRASAHALYKTIRACGYTDRMWTLVFGVMQDKDHAQMLESLGLLSKRILACSPATERALPVSELVSEALEYSQEVLAMESVAESVRLALSLGDPVLIAGSFYLAEEAMHALRAEGIRF